MTFSASVYSFFGFADISSSPVGADGADAGAATASSVDVFVVVERESETAADEPVDFSIAVAPRVRR